MECIDTEIDKKIIMERNDSLSEAEKELELMCDAFICVAKMLNLQGKQINKMETQVVEADMELETALESLSKAEEYTRFSKLSRNISLIVGSSAIGSVGFLFGPVVGISTTLVGTISGITAITFLK